MKKGPMSNRTHTQTATPSISPKSTAKTLVFALFAAFTLSLCVAWIAFYKIHDNLNRPYFSTDGHCFYWTENAFHFRHAQMVSEGKPIPELDIDIQYPEGLRTDLYITPVMERVSGTLHRLFFAEIPLHVFLTYFMALVSASSVGAVFLAGMFISRSKWVGLVAAIFYTLAPAAVVRSCGATFIREDFALPFIFYSFACFTWCLRNDSVIAAVIASLLLAIAMASWHLTQFYLLLFIGGLLIVFLFQKSEILPRRSFTILTITLLITALALPVLRAKNTAVSLPLMLSYGLTLALWYIHRVNIVAKRRVVCIASAALTFTFAALLIQHFLGGNSYIYQFILSKIRYLGELPQDSSLLPFEIKVTWTSSFISTPLRDFLLLLSPAVFFGLAMLVRLAARIFRRTAQPAEILTAYFAFSTTLFFLLINRLSVFAVFFIAIPAGYIVLTKSRILKALSIAGVVAAVVIAFHIFGRLGLTPARPPQQYVEDVVNYIKNNSAEDDAVLSSFQFGPSIAAYARRPVVLHSKFESQTIRDKVKEVYTALYATEDEFYHVCSKYGADLFVYQTNMALESAPASIRYMVGADALRSDSAAFLLHFAPEKLKHFHLVHQNFACRIFRIGEKPAEPPDITYIALYDLSAVCDPQSVGEIVDHSAIAEGLKKLDFPQTHKQLADRFLAKGDLDKAISEYGVALTMNDRYAEAGWGLGIAGYLSGRKQEGIESLKLALNQAPQMDPAPLSIPDASVWITLGDHELAANRNARAVKFFKKAIQFEPDSGEASLKLGTAQLALGRIPEAENALMAAISKDPKSWQAYEQLARLYSQSARYDKALEAVDKSLAINPNLQHLR